MIKYLGSKRRLVSVLGDLCERAGARTALDLFTGTTRVAQEFKRRGGTVNTLVASPTLDLGVDIGALDLVLCRNVPPTPAN